MAGPSRRGGRVHRRRRAPRARRRHGSARASRGRSAFARHHTLHRRGASREPAHVVGIQAGGVPGPQRVCRRRHRGRDGDSRDGRRARSHARARARGRGSIDRTARRAPHHCRHRCGRASGHRRARGVAQPHRPRVHRSRLSGASDGTHDRECAGVADRARGARRRRPRGHLRACLRSAEGRRAVRAEAGTRVDRSHRGVRRRRCRGGDGRA